MKLYDCKTAPSPRRVRMFLAEKGIDVPVVQVDLRSGEHLGEVFRALNPDCTVPALELDDGTAIAGITPICRYFEAVQPEPALMGRDAREKAVVDMWDQRCETQGFQAAAEAFRNATAGFKGRALTGPHGFDQIPELAERGRARVGHFFEMLEQRLGEAPFIAGEMFSIADITAFVTVDFARWAKLGPGDDAVHIARWYEAISARPCTRA